MEQIRAIYVAYSDWISMAAGIFVILFLMSALHRIRKIRKQMQGISGDVSKLLEKAESMDVYWAEWTEKISRVNGLWAGAEEQNQNKEYTSMTGQTLNSEKNLNLDQNPNVGQAQNVRTTSKDEPKNKKTETPETLLNAVLEEVFP